MEPAAVDSRASQLHESTNRVAGQKTASAAAGKESVNQPKRKPDTVLRQSKRRAGAQPVMPAEVPAAAAATDAAATDTASDGGILDAQVDAAADEDATADSEPPLSADAEQILQQVRRNRLLSVYSGVPDYGSYASHSDYLAAAAAKASLQCSQVVLVMGCMENETKPEVLATAQLNYPLVSAAAMAT